MRVLLVEDEVKLAALVARGLTEQGDVVRTVGTAADAVRATADGEYDVILLDVMLPDGDGFDVCRRLRARRDWTPVLMLTARTAVRDRIAGLDVGADDYLGKPFAFQELRARMRALVRRGPVPRRAELVVAGLRLDPASRRVWRGIDEIELSGREFALLEALMRRPGQVLSREQLLDRVWGGGDIASNVVDVYVGYLRQKIDRPFATRSIETIRGRGYRLAGGSR